MEENFTCLFYPFRCLVHYGRITPGLSVTSQAGDAGITQCYARIPQDISLLLLCVDVG